jgi:hypothetical protein
MTEAEWESCTDPDPLLEVLRDSASQRKLCLLGCAASRRLWDLLETTNLREAVAVFERFADDELDEESLRSAVPKTHPLMNYREEIFSGKVREDVCNAAYGMTSLWLGQTAIAARRPNFESLRRSLTFFALARAPGSGGGRCVVECAAQAEFIRDIFGNPFRPASFATAFPGGHNGIALKLATAVYEERELPGGTLDSVRLRLLADTLEEAGCTDRAVLDHLRGPEAHVRGCWALDAVLARQ